MGDQKVVDWFSERVKSSLQGKLNNEKFLKAFDTEENKAVLTDFVGDDHRILVAHQPSADKIVLEVEQSSPDKPGVYNYDWSAIKGKAMYFAKPPHLGEGMKLDDLPDLIINEFAGGEMLLDNLNLVAAEVFFPLLSNPANRAGWSGPTSKEIMLSFSTFLSQLTMVVGQLHGTTTLPNPPPEAFDEDNLAEKERQYLLETSVVQWTDKIEDVLKEDPEVLKINGHFPEPSEEVDFWIAKGKDLTKLHEQLTSEKMKAVMNTLLEMNSPFGTTMEKLTKDVATARDEANENSRFLKPLEKYFAALQSDLDFTTMEQHFAPMMHTILLIWQHSTTYDTQPRLICLIQEICNAIVNQATKNVSGEAIFRFIDDENVGEGRALLQTTIDICQGMKNAYQRAKVKSTQVLPEKAWDVPDELLFSRLDAFLQRCHDILEFTVIVVEFVKLEKVCCGGTKGNGLTDDLFEIYQDFRAAVDHLQGVKYDIMDITASEFDANFFSFRCEVKALERRVSTVLAAAFDDCSAISLQFKLLESFEGLLERPLVKENLETQQNSLLRGYIRDLTVVQEIFHTHKNDPRVDSNMPPISGALTWCRSLLDRIKEPIDQVRLFTSSCGEEVEEMEKMYDSIVVKLEEYEAKKITEWTSEIDSQSQAKLMQSLLNRDKESRMIAVNFDPALVRLLREVKYSLLLKLEVPPNALAIYEKATMYRTQIGNLELIVHMYNEMMETLHMVERPLVEKEIAHIDETIEKGISELNWKSPEVNEFTKVSMDTVKAVYQTVKIMKDNFEKIKKMMGEYAKVPLAERKNKTLSPSEFEENIRKLWSTRHGVIAKHQETVMQLLTETNEALKVNKGSPIWRAYVEYVQDHIRDGLAVTIVNSIKFICEQLDAAVIEKNELIPILEIKLGLYANDVLFNAEDTTNADGNDKAPRKSRRDVWQIVNDWVEGFFEIGNIMTRVDGSHYVGDLKKNEGIVRFINTLKKHLDLNQKECETYRQEYLKYEFLWKTDRKTEFDKFLAQSSSEASASETKAADADDDEGEEEDKGPKDEDNVFLPLDKFEERIVYYNQLQTEISEKKPIVEIGWLKINSQPIKNALGTWASRWVHTFTSYLYNDVTRKLNQLETLMNEVNEGVGQEVGAGDSGALKAVLGHIHQVRSREKLTPKMFPPLRDSASLLKKYGKPLDEYELKLLADAPMRWDSTVNNVYKVKEKVNTLQNDEVENIKRRVWDFNDELAEFRRQFRRHAPFNYDVGLSDAYDRINEFHQKITEKEREAEVLIDLEQVFELNVSKHTEIKKSRLENKLLKQIWDMISIVKNQFEDWKKTLWEDIDTDALVAQCKKLNVQITAMPKDMRNWKVYLGLQAEVKNLLTVLPLVNLLHSPCMEERHWRDLKNATGKQFNKDKDFRLQNILELHLHKHVADVEGIVELANKESKIAGNLEKIRETWKGLTLEFGVHEKNGLKVAMIVSTDEILTALEENMQALQGMQGQGKYVEHFIDEVTKWQQSLGTTESVLLNWLEVQQKWQSLESIYLGSKDIRIQLPEDSRRFDEIDANWKTLMGSAESVPAVIESCSTEGRSELLQKMNVGLDQCEKSLFMYLETKRMAFPRFYFMANAALLDILSNGHDPQAVQKHLGDCFDNIKKLEYYKNDDGSFTKSAHGMYSKDGDEYVEWSQPFEATGAVEQWLGALVRHQQAMMTEILAQAKFTADHWDVEKPRHVWVFDYPAQPALTASQIIWTEEVNSQFDAFADGNEQAMKEYSKTLTARLEAFIELVLGSLTKCERVKIITLITVDVHNRDVVTRLIDEKIQEASGFAWQSQMRYEWKPDERICNVKVADATFVYSHEYVGNTGRLVITPLTDRCYITLTQALRLIMGGAPAGPAGTGKTETTKDLARAMGLPCYVFNCSEQMNVQSMGAIFKGLCQTGAWGCFDEFNRIPIETLSVVATQVACLLNAVRAGKEEFDFMGEIVKMIPTMGAFITMNPGYAGRTELPENLKALFRSCAMVVPDMELICENMLMSEGFLGARRLGKKFITLYGLSKELLSKQMHYDWGLRATKAVLRVAGGLKRAEPEVDEDRILMRALRDFNLPKLVDEDKPIFVQLVDDLFPGLGGTVRKFDIKLQQSIAAMALERGLQPDEVFVLKCVELAELMDIRHSVFVIGPAGCGKTEIWKTLAKGLNNLGLKTVCETLNPKAVRNRELYGWLSKADWYDGVLSTLMRNMARDLPPFSANQVGKWVVLDGDIDPEWIESLNTVMDDNKVLTLVSNERIPLSPSMRMVFEIANLDNATPATVSRAGIIYVNAKDVGYKPFLDSWIESRSDDKQKSSLLALFNKYVTPENLHELKVAFKRPVPLSEVNVIKTFAFLLEGLLETMTARLKKTKNIDPVLEKEIFEANFVFAGVWAFGGALIVDKQMDCRKDFSEWWKRVFPTIKFPKEGTVFDYFPDDNGKMTPWSEKVMPYNPPADAYLVTKVFVPTVDSTSSNFLLDLLVYRQRACLMVGTAGTGKSVLIQNYLRALPESFCFSAININYYTDAKALQRIMEGSIDKRSGRTFGPPGTKKLIYFIDDLNMSFVDLYGTQTPNALIRQHMDYQSWYDTTKLEKKEIQDVQYISCMNPTSGSFTINPRLQGNFCTFSTQLPTKGQLQAIYNSVMKHHFSSFSAGIQAMTEALVDATLHLHDSVATKFLPSSKKFHYQFNLRDLAAVFQGLSMSQPKAKLSPTLIVELWHHEVCRVFSDRLIVTEDCDEFDKLLSSSKNKFLKDFISEAPAPQLKEGESPPVDAKVWTSFIHADAFYTPVKDVKILKDSLQAKLDEYNESNVVMNLELFGMAMDHVTRIVRIIENPRGNAMLVGVGGSGKQSLARLSCFICGYDVFQISVSQSYGMNDLKADLQDLYLKAGVKNIPICFLLTDTQIGDDEWLVFINDLLNTGFIPDLFGDEDLDGIFNSIRSEAKAQGVSEDRQSMMDFFLSQVRTNLHLVLAFSPVGEAFRVRCRKFPGLINCCVIDWFHPWPRDALVSVCFRFLEDIDMPDYQDALSKHMAEVHLSVNTISAEFQELERRYNYTTPKSYLEFIEFYKKLLAQKTIDLAKQSGRLEKGITTLRATASDVAQLKEDLTVTLVQVGEKQASVSALIGKMGIERGKVEEQQAVAAIEAQKSKAVADVANKIAADCERDLAAALPIMERAKDAVACLDKASLTTLKSFAQPPGNCVYVTNAVMILKGFPGKRDWPNAKKMMKDVGGFLNSLVEFDATTVSEETIAKLQPILTQPFFTADQMASSSEAAANLCGWVVNICAYNQIYKTVAPKMAAQAKAQEEFNVANAALKAVEAQVAALQKKTKRSDRLSEKCY
jgi:dynein heavy chain